VAVRQTRKGRGEANIGGERVQGKELRRRRKEKETGQDEREEMVGKERAKVPTGGSLLGLASREKSLGGNP